MSHTRHYPTDQRTRLGRATTCPVCGKGTYLSRKDARTAARRNHPGARLHAYECEPGSGRWHYGHLPRRKADPHFPAPPIEGDTPA